MCEKNKWISKLKKKEKAQYKEIWPDKVSLRNLATDKADISTTLCEFLLDNSFHAELLTAFFPLHVQLRSAVRGLQGEHANVFLGD